MLTITVQKDGVTLLQVSIPETGGAAQIASSSSDAVAENRLGANFRETQSRGNGNGSGGQGGDGSRPT